MYLPYKLYPSQVGFIKLTQNSSSVEKNVFNQKFEDNVENATLILQNGSHDHPIEFEF
jgi:hypothetical protein